MPNIFLNPKYFTVKNKGHRRYIDISIDKKCLYPFPTSDDLDLFDELNYNRIMSIRISFKNNINEYLAWVYIPPLLTYSGYAAIRIYEDMQFTSFTNLTKDLLK